MPNNRLGSQPQKTPMPRGFNGGPADGELHVLRNVDGHALEPDLIDRGDGVMIPEYRNTHIVNERVNTPEESDYPLDFPDE